MVLYFVDSHYHLIEVQSSEKELFENKYNNDDYLIMKIINDSSSEKFTDFIICDFIDFIKYNDVSLTHLSEQSAKKDDNYYRVFSIKKCEASNQINKLNEKNKEEKDERGYLDLLKEIIYTGDYRETRNAKTFSLFGRTLKFDLKEKYPLLTTKRTFFRGVIEELIFFLQGKTNSKLLEEKGINIWKGNTSKEFIKKMGFEYEEGDMGPMYGFNWSHFGAEYKGMNHQYSDDEGYNQIKKVLELIKSDPHSRRILFTTFNPQEAEKGVLYPCHGLISQMYCIEKDGFKYLSLNTYQRSADAFLGLPFNIASYGALVYLFCKILGPEYKPGELIINLGDLHIYENHVEQCLEQISRKGYQFPKLNIKDFKMQSLGDFSKLKYEDFELIDYKCHNTIKADMVA